MSLSPSSWREREGDSCAADPSAQVFDQPEGFCDLSGSRIRQERLPSRLVRLSGSARAYKSVIYTAVEHISIREITCLTGYLPSLSPGSIRYAAAVCATHFLGARSCAACRAPEARMGCNVGDADQSPKPLRSCFPTLQRMVPPQLAAVSKNGDFIGITRVCLRRRLSTVALST